MHIVSSCLIVVLFSLGLWSGAVAANPLQVFACEPEWAALAREVGGDGVQVYSATTAMQDPHRIQARPSLIAKMRRADLLICTGAGLEAGWLPLLLRRAANPAVQPGQPGYLLAAEHVPLLDKPVSVDRSHGDVHIEGDPHLHSDPRNIAKVAEVLSQRLQQLRPAQQARFSRQGEQFLQKWRQAISRWEQQAKPLRNMPIVTQHKSWTYLINWLGLKEVARLEAKPGLPPGAVYLEQVLAQLKKRPARVIIRAAYQPERAARWLKERSQIPVLVLPYTVGGTEQATDLFSLFDSTISGLLAHRGGP